MIEVELPNGTVLEFPDGTPDAVIDKAAKAAISPAKPITLQQAGNIVTGLARGYANDFANLNAGALRGAGSIGATLLAPVDIAKDALAGKGLSLESNRQRRAMMDAGLQNMGADTDSVAFGTGKLAAEVMGTAGAGGLLSKVVGAIPGVATKAPMLVEALRTGGMNLGGTTGSRAADMGIRMLGGGGSGAVTAGLINPEDADQGAAIGAFMPPALQAAGEVGKSVGRSIANKYAKAVKAFRRNAPLNKTIKESVEAGYVIPPNMVNPSFKNQVVESISGKQATQQVASTKNNEVTGKLVRKALEIADDAPLNRGTLETIRKDAGGAYGRVADLSDQAAADLEALKTARNEAQGWFKAYNRSARPDDLAKAKEARALTEKLEAALEKHASEAGKDHLIPALREARKRIAKTYTVERALTDASGNVDARVLGRMHEKGLPLSDGLDTVGRFGSAFGTVAKTPEAIGSPAAHNLKSLASLILGIGGGAAAGPVGVAAAAVPFVAPPAARSIMFRQGAQRALIPTAPTMGKAWMLADLLQNPEMQLMLARTMPAISAQSR